MIEQSELIDFFDKEYIQEESADDLKKTVRENIKSFATENSISIKAINSAYSLYKRYKKGKQSDEDMNEMCALSDLVDSYFNS